MHLPVLLKEAIDVLALENGDIYLDATLGEGGHAEEVFKRFGDNLTIAGIDADKTAIAFAQSRIETAGHRNFKSAPLNFREIEKAPQILGIGNPNKILFDLGWSKRQFEESGKGFSFQKDEPLNMSFGENPVFSAYDVVNHWVEENIRTIISAYGEEKYSSRIAKAIIESRKKNPIKTSRELADIIVEAVPARYRHLKIHPATKTFQALRIVVNDELRSLENGLHGAYEILKNGGRIAVISFHSLEDRIVKKFFKKLNSEEKAEILTKKPIRAGEEELAQNPRARSAKLRAISKIK